MSDFASKVVSELEGTFDIPFGESSGSRPDRWREITPVNNLEEFFTVRLTWRGAVRLIAEFLPQRYSANFIRSMGRAGLEKRNDFASIVQVMQRRSSKVKMSINGADVDPTDLSTWPSPGVEWLDMRFRAEVVVPYELYQDEKGTKALEDEWAMLAVGAVLSLVRIGSRAVESELEASCGCEEGTAFEIRATRYERSAINRRLCIDKLGMKCSVCGFDFAASYGELGRGFIHVHHVVPVSKIGPNYRIDPERDLVPVCPNCHCMLHRSNPPLMPSELKKVLEEAKGVL